MPRRKRFGSDPSNTAENGDFIVGKARPPESGKFRKGDGRTRGRRPKGTNNLATDLRKELGSSVAVTVGGVPKKVSRQRAIVMRLADNATKGQNSAIALTLEYQQRLVDPALAREEQQRLAQTKQDFSRLSIDELRILRYLMSKSYEDKSAPDSMIGVIPVFKDGSYISAESRAFINAGLASYGIEIDEGSSFPPICRPIKIALDDT